MAKDKLIEINEQLEDNFKDFFKMVNTVLKTKKANDEQINSTLVYLGTLMNLTSLLSNEVKKLRDRIDQLERKPRAGFESKN